MLDDSDEDEEGILAQINDLQAKLKKSKSRKRVQKTEEKELTAFEKMKMDEELHVLKQQVEDNRVQREVEELKHALEPTCIAKKPTSFS